MGILFHSWKESLDKVEIQKLSIIEFILYYDIFCQSFFFPDTSLFLSCTNAIHCYDHKASHVAPGISVGACLHLCTVYFSVYIHCTFQGQIRLSHCPLVLRIKSIPVLEIGLKLTSRDHTCNLSTHSQRVLNSLSNTSYLNHWAHNNWIMILCS